MKRKQSHNSIDWEAVRAIAGALPEAVEGTSYGTPAFFVRKKLFVRLHQSEEALVINMTIEEREALLLADPDTFYITDHYLNYPWVLVRLASVNAKKLRPLLEESWRRCAPKALIAAFDAKS